MCTRPCPDFSTFHDPPCPDFSTFHVRQVLLPWMIEWVGIMTNQNHRGMRHTASEVAMAMISKLAEIKSGVDEKRAQKVRAPSLRLPCTLDLTCT